MKNIIMILVCIPIVVIGFGLSIYFFVFHGQLSHQSADWANFATFNNYFIGILNLFVLGLISLLTYKTVSKFNTLQLKPVLYLRADIASQQNEFFGDSWILGNISSTPALNILVRFTFIGKEKDEYSKTIPCYSVGPTAHRELSWIHFADKIELYYMDMSGEKYYLLEYVDLHARTVEIKEELYKKQFDKAKHSPSTTDLTNSFTIYLQNGEKKGEDFFQICEHYHKNFYDAFLRDV